MWLITWSRKHSCWLRCLTISDYTSWADRPEFRVQQSHTDHVLYFKIMVTHTGLNDSQVPTILSGAVCAWHERSTSAVRLFCLGSQEKVPLPADAADGFYSVLHVWFSRISDVYVIDQLYRHAWCYGKNRVSRHQLLMGSTTTTTTKTKTYLQLSSTQDS